MRVQQAIQGLDSRINKDAARTVPFKEFAALASTQPKAHLRSIFQYFEDMLMHFARRLPDTELKNLQSITDNIYDPDSLFVTGLDQPFFTDHFFMEEIVRLAHGLAQGQQNRFYMIAGDPGSGKSRLVNALLTRFEQYSRVPEGLRYETVWKFNDHDDNFEVPCPHHDNPILLVPKERRRDFLRELIEDPKDFQRITSNTGYSWLWTKEACPVCDSIASGLRKDGFEKVIETAHARSYQFSRKTGQGLAVYNPGDEVVIDEIVRNQELETRLNKMFGGSPHIPYYHSRLAQTNDGVLVIMDVQGNNTKRLRKLHSIISDEVHRAIDLEERTGSLFFITINPEQETPRGKETEIELPSFSLDTITVPTQAQIFETSQPAPSHAKKNKNDTEDLRFLREKSFVDRARVIAVPYLLDYKRELALYHSQFSDKTLRYGFLPGIVQAFAKSVVSSRICNQRSEAVALALGNRKDAYAQYCDANYVILRLDLFAGVMPPWLTDEDRKGFTKEALKHIRHEFPDDGHKGISGRDANEFLSKLLVERDRVVGQDQHDRLGMIRLGSFIRNDMLCKDGGRQDLVKQEFLDALQRTYHFDILQQINSALFHLNPGAVDEEVDDYLFLLSLFRDQAGRSPFTGRELIASASELEATEVRIGVLPEYRDAYRDGLRQDLASLHLSVGSLTRDILHQQEVFRKVRDGYVNNVRSNTLRTYGALKNLREAVREYDTDGFRAYDGRVGADARRLLIRLQRQYKYTLPGAKQIVQYVIDNNLHLPESERPTR